MKLELRRVTVATPSARNARQSWPERQRLLVRVSDADGFGLGEASPLPGYSRESLDDVERALRPLAHPSPLTTHPSDLPPAARFALETALLDYEARRAGEPAPVQLGARRDAQVRLSCLIGAGSDAELVERGQRAVREGYRHLKVKVGASGRQREELGGIERLREAVGRDVKLRLDANGAWSAVDLSQVWPMLRGFEIDFFEEPGELPEALRGELPLALDESLQGVRPDELEALITRTGARAVVLKPMALGGLARCAALAERARAVGCRVVVSHCFEGPLGFRAVTALAFALPGDEAHGLAPYPEASFEAPGAVISSWSEPGLDELGGWA